MEPNFEAPVFMETFFAIFAIIFIAVVALILFASVRNYKTLKRRGVDPIAPTADLIGRIANSDLLASSPNSESVENRLTDLDSLKARNLVSEDEYQELRKKILNEI